MSGAPPSIMTRPERTSGSSSTTRTRTVLMAPPRE
jgi:hypothetical protein